MNNNTKKPPKNPKPTIQPNHIRNLQEKIERNGKIVGIPQTSEKKRKIRF